MPDANNLLDDRDGDDDEAPPKKKQKRNKPTLSCSECVDRKTKVKWPPDTKHTLTNETQCDRARPTCLACVKRGSECKYSEVANQMAASRYEFFR